MPRMPTIVRNTLSDRTTATFTGLAGRQVGYRSRPSWLRSSWCSNVLVARRQRYCLTPIFSVAYPGIGLRRGRTPPRHQNTADRPAWIPGATMAQWVVSMVWRVACKPG